MGEVEPTVPRIQDALGPLIGREKKLAILESAYSALFSVDAAQAVSLVGATGSGKTRLAEEFLASLSLLESRPRVIRVKAGRQGLSYGVFNRIFRSRLGISDEMSDEMCRKRVTLELASVLQDHNVDDVCFFIGQMMGLHFNESPLTQAVSADLRQVQALQAAVTTRFLEADAKKTPLVVFIDELHLADGDSLDLLENLIDRVEANVLFVFGGSRELLGQREDWSSSGGIHHQLIELEALSETAANQLIRSMLDRCAGGTPDALVSAAVGAAGGNPGQLVQMVKSFFDSGVLEEDPRDKNTWHVNLDRLSTVRLPMSVDEAVALRISALSPDERIVMEHAAAVGNVFWFGSVLTMGRIGRSSPSFWVESESSDTLRVEQILERLVNNDYLLALEDGVFSDEREYIFKHNFEREKLNSLTSASSSRRYHQAIADWLAQKSTARSREEFSAMLARHLEKAGSFTRSAFTFLDAGDVARSSFALRKACEYYEKGLKLLGDDDARRRIDALHDYGDALMSLGKTEQAKDAFLQMLTVAYQLNLQGKGGAAHNRIGRLYRETGFLTDAELHLEASRKLFKNAGDKRGVAASIDDLGKILWMRGEYDKALKEMRKSLDMRRELGDRRSIALSLNNIGLVWMDHGRPVQAKEALEAALSIRREIVDPVGVADSLNTLGSLAVDQNQDEHALQYFQEAHQALSDIGERKRIAESLTHIGKTLCRLGALDKSISVLEEAGEISEELGDKMQLAEARRGLAKSYLSKGQLKEARRNIRSSVDLFGEIRSKAHLAIALRTLGEVTGAGAWGEEYEGRAVEYFMRSIAIAKEIGNELEVARSYIAFSDYVSQAVGLQQNQEIQRESIKLRTMAEEIFENHRIESLSEINI